jgi:branched-chain amino acid transport system permease protein
MTMIQSREDFAPAVVVPRRGNRAALPALAKAAIVLVLLIGVALPLLVSDYRLFQWSMVLCYTVALLGLNLLTGYTGQISLGHGAFFAIGAYTMAIATFHFGIPFWLAVPMAGLVCFVVGFLFGIPALRLEGIYLALATFSLAIAVPQLLKVTAFQGWTGGVSGVVVRRPEVPLGLPLNQMQWLFYVILALAALAYFITWNLTRGRIGRALRAIRDNSLAASTMGVDLSFYKCMAFAVSALLTGVAGGLSAMCVQFVGPDSFGFFLSISLLVGAVIGGLGSMIGPLFGAVFIVLVPNVAEQFSEAAPFLIYGIILIGSMYVMPKGVAGLINRFGRRAARS